MSLQDVFTSLRESPATPKEGEIPATSPFDISQRGATNETIQKFKGVDRQLVINTSDGHRPVIMDGNTLGGKAHIAVLELGNDFKVAPTVPTAENIEVLSNTSVLNKEDTSKLIDTKVSKISVAMEVVDNISQATEEKTLYFVK